MLNDQPIHPLNHHKKYNHHLYGNNMGQQIQNNDGITEEIITDMTKDENIEKNNNFEHG